MAAKQYTSVLVDVAGRVATITLNRPEAANAVTFDMDEELQDAVRVADADDAIGCIVITGSGKAFCSGDDVSQTWGDPRMEQTMAELAGPNPPMTPFVELMLGIGTPTIAAVNGAAVGSGMDVALACDIRLASPWAKFAQLYVRLGLMPDVLGLWLLPQLVGRSRATELLLTGDLVDAAEAERIGLVSRVVAAEKLLSSAQELGGRIAANPALSIQRIKAGLRLAAGRSISELPEVATFVGHGLAALFQTDDHKEAAQAFLERREPTFKGT